MEWRGERICRFVDGGAAGLLAMAGGWQAAATVPIRKSVKSWDLHVDTRPNSGACTQGKCRCQLYSRPASRSICHNSRTDLHDPFTFTFTFMKVRYARER